MLLSSSKHMLQAAKGRMNLLHLLLWISIWHKVLYSTGVFASKKKTYVSSLLTKIALPGEPSLYRYYHRPVHYILSSCTHSNKDQVCQTPGIHSTQEIFSHWSIVLASIWSPIPNFRLISQKLPSPHIVFPLLPGFMISIISLDPPANRCFRLYLAMA